MPDAASLGHEHISFGEYVDHVGMRRPLVRAFERHMRDAGLNFNYRTQLEWDRVRTSFLTTHRGGPSGRR